MKINFTSIKAKLVFASQAELHYDSEHRVLYVRTATSEIQKYKNISPTVWNNIKATKSLRDLVLFGAPYTIVTKIPRNLEVFIVPEQSITMYKVNSSNIDYIGYDEENQQLYIQFLSNGSIYRYENVDLNMWRTIWSVESVGSWFYWFMRINDGTFPYTKLSGSYNLEYTDETLPNSVAHPNGYLTEKR